MSSKLILVWLKIKEFWQVVIGRFRLAGWWSHRQLALALSLGLISFAIFGYWSLVILDRAESVQVVAAAQDLIAPHVLTKDDLTVLHLPRGSVPQNALVDIKDALGLTLIHPLAPQQLLTLNEVAGKLDTSLGGYIIPQGKYGFIFPSSWTLNPLPKVKTGDTVTLVVSAAGKEAVRQTGIVGRALPVRGVREAGDGSLQSIVLAVDLPTALTILQTRANNLLLSVLVEGVGPL